MDCSLAAVNWHAHIDLTVVGLLRQLETMSGNDAGDVRCIQNVQQWTYH